MPTPGDYELVLTPTKVLTEGTGTSHAPYIVATDLTAGTSLTAWTDNDDASYGKCDAGRSSRGNYPLWSDIDPSIDPSWVTAIGVRFRALTPSTDPVDYFVVQLFGQTSKLLSNPFIGSEAPLVPGLPDAWHDFDYVVADADYDTTGWAPDGVQSALEQTFVYCRIRPSDVSGEFTGSGVLQVSEQSIVIYYTVPDTGPIDLPCNTTVDLPLAAATFENPTGSQQFGQLVDGVITGLDGFFPQFTFNFELEVSKGDEVTVTFDPGSAHDGDGDSGTSDRFVLLYTLFPGSEVTGGDGVQIGDGFSNTADVCTLTIGPGVGNWDDASFGVTQGYTRLLFQTSGSGAVSAVSIKKLCALSVPPLRLTNRDDQFSSAPRLAGRRSRQGSARITGYL